MTDERPQAHDVATADAAPPGRTRLERLAGLVLMVYWPLLAIGTHWPRLPVPERPAYAFDDILQLDKAVHALGFGGLMALMLLSGLGKRLAWPGRCVLSLGICLAYAAVDEYSQRWMPERTVSWADAIANFIGIIGVYLVARQPGRRERQPVQWLVLVPMLTMVPLVGYALLSPWMMSQLIKLKREVLPPGLIPLDRLDYVGHGVGALVVSLIVITIWPTRSRRPRVASVLALLFLLLSGPGVEIVQHYTGRGVQALDVLGHSVGVLIAMVLWAVWPLATRNARAVMKTSAPDADGSTSFVGHAVLVSALTLVSRFAGLGRDAILAAALGLSVAADAFFIGFLVPNLFRRLFGEGALSAAFIPNYTDLRERDPELAKRFATLTLLLLSVLLIGITLIAELALWWIARSIDETHKAALAIQYTRLMLPYMPMICAVALIGGILQVHKRFGPPAAAPLILNGVIVLAVLLATAMFTRDTAPSKVATWVGVGVLVAGLLQLWWQAVVLLQVTGLSRSFKGCWPTMRSMLLMMGPMVIGLAVFQINALLDALIAFFFAPGPAGADGSIDPELTVLGQTFDAPLRNGDVAALNWSQRLYQFPLGVFGIAIATAIFPALSAAASRFMGDGGGDDGLKLAKPQAALGEFATIVRHGLRLTVFIALPASAGLILVRVPLARTVFEHGTFTSDDALRVSFILAGYASSVWAYSMTHTLTRAFYALKDAKTPLKVSAAMVLLNLTLNLSLIWSLGAAGLAWSTAISAACQVVLLVLLLGKRIDRPIDAGVIASWTRTMVATAVMAGVLFAVTFFIDPLALSWNRSAALLAGMVALGIAVYFAIVWLSRAEELRWLSKRSVK